jgi:hypothetical protein
MGEAKGTPAPLAASRPLITCHIPHSETIRIRVLRQANAHSVLRMDLATSSFNILRYPTVADRRYFLSRQ